MIPTMTNGHHSTEQPPRQLVIPLPRRWLIPLLAFAAGVAADRSCTVRDERPASVGYVCSPPCQKGQACHKGTCVDVATSRRLAHQECLPTVEVILRTAQ